MDDLEDAKNLGDLEVKYPVRTSGRQFMGVKIPDVEGTLTEGNYKM